MTVETANPIAQAPMSRESRRGFTLTEIAIVLGIIGLILGAIWVAAAAVYNNMRTNTAQTELLQVTQAVRSYYATATLTDATADMILAATPAAANIIYAQAGIFPNNMLQYTAAGVINGVGDPWDGGAAVHSAPSAAGTALAGFSVGFSNLPQQACIDFLSTATGPSRDTGMYQAGAAKGGALPAGVVLVPGVPLTAATIAGQCTGTGTGANANAVAFYFNLHG